MLHHRMLSGIRALELSLGLNSLLACQNHNLLSQLIAENAPWLPAFQPAFEDQHPFVLGITETQSSRKLESKKVQRLGCKAFYQLPGYWDALLVLLALFYHLSLTSTEQSSVQPSHTDLVLKKACTS